MNLMKSDRWWISLDTYCNDFEVSDTTLTYMMVNKEVIDYYYALDMTDHIMLKATPVNRTIRTKNYPASLQTTTLYTRTQYPIASRVTNNKIVYTVE